MTYEELKLKADTLQLQLDCAVAGLKAAKRVRSVGEDVRKAVDTALETVEAVTSASSSCDR